MFFWRALCVFILLVALAVLCFEAWVRNDVFEIMTSSIAGLAGLCLLASGSRRRL